ncbi:MAG: fibronectin type III domain-containing protein [Candidatus Thiodiazotropha sp. (ex Monitilora ramsayi)]|nr:fibronectin type III domain-containing protein [Candidatus Thiodiazotropha sp. (ex Monitilora ramsayi)]
MRRSFHIIAVLIFTSVLTACGNNSSTTSQNSEASPPVNAKDTVNLSWIAPSTRADGTYISPNELAGYKVYMGSSASNMEPLVDLNDDTITQYTVNDLPAGSYYFAVSAYDADGLESGYSQVIQVNLS